MKQLKILRSIFLSPLCTSVSWDVWIGNVGFHNLHSDYMKESFISDSWVKNEHAMLLVYLLVYVLGLFHGIVNDLNTPVMSCYSLLRFVSMISGKSTKFSFMVYSAYNSLA